MYYLVFVKTVSCEKTEFGNWYPLKDEANQYVRFDTIEEANEYGAKHKHEHNAVEYYVAQLVG